jgi:hypothetical protein
VVVLPRGTLVREVGSFDAGGALFGPEKVDAIAEMVGEMEGDLAIRVRFTDVEDALALGE